MGRKIGEIGILERNVSVTQSIVVTGQTILIERGIEEFRAGLRQR